MRRVASPLKEVLVLLLALTALLAAKTAGGQQPKGDPYSTAIMLQTLNERMAAFVKGGGRTADIATGIKLDDLNWPFQPEALHGLYDELSKR